MNLGMVHYIKLDFALKNTLKLFVTFVYNNVRFDQEHL